MSLNKKQNFSMAYKTLHDMLPPLALFFYFLLLLFPLTHPLHTPSYSLNISGLCSVKSLGTFWYIFCYWAIFKFWDKSYFVDIKIALSHYNLPNLLPTPVCPSVLLLLMYLCPLTYYNLTITPTTIQCLASNKGPWLFVDFIIFINVKDLTFIQQEPKDL